MSADSIISFVRRTGTAVLAVLLCLPAVAFAQSPWERAASNLEQTFTGPLARSLALVAIVIGGLMFMFGEGGAKRQICGIVFGGGLALFAAQFLDVAVLTRRHGVSRRSAHARSPDVPTRLQGAASPADDVGRRPPAVLPGAAARAPRRSTCSTRSSPAC